MALEAMVRLLFSTALAKMAKVPLSVQTRRQYYSQTISTARFDAISVAAAASSVLLLCKSGGRRIGPTD